MSQSFLTPDKLFDRPWQPGHAFGRKPSRLRRAFMMMLFLLLCSIIAGYLYLTDADRVRSMAQQYLTQLIGGKVEVGGAALSIFEGLRLKDVKISVDATNSPDSLLFSAQQFHIKYGVRELIAGRIEAAQMVAIEPHVYLTENVDSGRWNYQRLVREPRAVTKPTQGGRMIGLPEIMLRNAQVDYDEIRGGERSKLASVTIEAHCVPSADGQRLLFELQSRGGDSELTSTMGPTATGAVDRDLRAVSVQVRDIELLRLSSMLPNQVRLFAARHDLRGRVDVPVLVYQPARDGQEANYRVVMELGGVKLKVRPQEWLSKHELERQDWTIHALDLMRDAGMNNTGATSYLTSLVEAAPIELDQVSGRFEFTQEGITISGMKGRIENNELNIDGEIKGYSPTSPVSIHVASSPKEHIVIPTAPRYASAMPRQMLDVYDNVRPFGKCDLKVSLNRPTDGARLEVAGAVDIIDGGLCYSKFAYPLRKASGRIQFGPDAETGMDCVKLINLKGRGVAGGPNENVIVNVDGIIGPLPGEPAVDVTVSADGVRNEPALMRAFPYEVHEAFHFMDADGKGELPTFVGSFVCKVRKNLGERKPNIETTVQLLDGAGKMSVFPYPLQNVTGMLHIVDGAVEIRGVKMKRAQSELQVDGTVSWRAGIGRALATGEHHGDLTPVRPDLKIAAKNVQVDRELLMAMPAAQRNWLEKVGAIGKFDLSGWVRSEPSKSLATRPEEIVHEFDIALHQASIWPIDGVYAVSNLEGNLHLYPSGMEIRSLTGKHGKGDLNVSGSVAWPQNRPSLALDVKARNLELDQTLYHVLPEGARSSWDSIRPEGSVDADLNYRGGVAIGKDSETPPPAATQPATQAVDALAGLNLTVRPKKLAVTLKAIPYRLDDVQGVVQLKEGRIVLDNITAKHGPANVALSGTGWTSKMDWDLKVKSDHLAVDDELRKAMPGALAGVVTSMKLGGNLDVDFTKLLVRGRSNPTTQAIVIQPPPAAGDAPLDMDFVARINGTAVSADLGVPISDMNPAVELAGSVRNGKLDGLAGPIDAPAAIISGRPVKNLHAEVFKPSGQDGLRVGNLRAQMAGGEVAGQVDVVFPEHAPSKYVMNLVLKGADCRQLTGEKDIAGEMNASLALEGEFGNANNRRGRGDVSVNGKTLYKMPLVLGLLQVTNLSLPLSSPFNEGSARYNVTGQKVMFESIEVRAKDLLISGSGQLDFGTKKVNLTFTTDNPNWPKVPILGDIVQTAKQELLQIHVKGTLQEPKVSASAMSTFTTTVDEVLKGDAK
jgi:hypothetical protein